MHTGGSGILFACFLLGFFLQFFAKVLMKKSVLPWLLHLLLCVGVLKEKHVKLYNKYLFTTAQKYEFLNFTVYKNVDDFFDKRFLKNVRGRPFMVSRSKGEGV